VALFGIDFAGIFSAIKGFLGPLGKLFDSGKAIYDHLVGIFGSAKKLTDSVLSEVTAWRNFKQDIRFSQRVVQIERAVQKTRDLVEGIPAAWHSILDIIKQVKSRISSEPTPEDVSADIEDVESGGVKNFLSKFPKLAKGLEKLLGVLALIVDGLQGVADTIDDLQTIVDEITRLREEIEKLDTIFLPQSNKRKTLKLVDGSSIRVRIGKLHH